MRRERELGVESICGGGKAKLLESLNVRDEGPDAALGHSGP